jgi:hypothetical protein
MEQGLEVFVHGLKEALRRGGERSASGVAGRISRAEKERSRDRRDAGHAEERSAR